MNDVEKLCLETIEMGKQAIVFVPSRASAEKTAEQVSKLTSLFYPEFKDQVLKAASSPTRQCKRLGSCVHKGVAFHHAGLLQKQKDLIEEEFKSGKIRIIAATPTLAAGLSLPVFRVIITSLKRFSNWGMDWIPVLEYLQMAGRAGRPEYEKFGESVVMAKNNVAKQEIYEKYVCGDPEEIYSKLAVEPVLRMYVLSLVSSGIVRDEAGLKEFFGKTFWAHQFEDMAKLEAIMDKMIKLLQEWNFIEPSGDSNDTSDFIIASNLGEKKDRILKPTKLGRRVSELYLDPLTAKHLLDCMERFNSDKGVFSILQMISNTLEMRPLLRVKAKEEEFIQQELVKNYELLLMDEPSAFDIEYNDFMNSIKTALFFMEWIDEKEEDFLLEKFNIRPGEIRVKNNSADWLLYACEELGRLLEFKDLVKEVRKLRVRIKHGVKEEVLPMLKLKGIGRVRARKLFTNGIRDLGGIKKLDITTLSQIVGSKLAVDLKRQVGEDFKEIISPKKRIGQMSLSKF
jgi:helicase